MRPAVIFLSVFAAFGQLPPSQESTVMLANPATTETVTQMTTIVKTVASVLNVSFDRSRSSFTLRAPQNQLNLAAWLLHAADKPAGWQPPQSADAGNEEYVLQGGGLPIDNSVPITRIRYLRNSSARDAVEIQTALRAVAGIPLVAVCDRPRLIVLRGTATEARLGDWLIGQLDVPATTAAALRNANPYSNNFSLPPRANGAEDIVRVIYLSPKTDAAGARSLGEKIRETTNTATVFSKSAPPVIVVRGDSTLLAQAQQIVDASTAQ